MKNYLLLLAVAASVSLASCGNDDDEVAPTKTDMLTGKKWKQVAETETRSDTTGTIDTFAPVVSCDKDDLLVFKTDSKLIFDEGATKCDPNDPQEFEAGTWALTNNESKLTLTILGFPVEGDIVELTTTKLVTRTTDVDQGVTTVTTATFEGQ